MSATFKRVYFVTQIVAKITLFKNTQVENWLKNILKGSSIPVFELNEDTLSILENCKLYFDNLEQYEEDHQFQMKLETEEFHVESE